MNCVSVIEDRVNYTTAAAGPYGWDADAGDEARSEPCNEDTQ